ncbi:MAG: MerR family transcriptional regulator [Spirochaetales bacterium]|nr:MerR family transcriptional regulator [Spirochaetales bacterium]
MNTNLFHLDELTKKSGIDAATLKEWIESGILVPEGFAGDSTPIFSDTSLETIKKISTLIGLGYGIEEIKKIIKKVGLPSDPDIEKSRLNGKDNYLTVGALADSLGISTRTIKHWEEKGIIEPDLRSQGGFRLYRDHYILFCKLIKDLQLFGYSLDEIKTISDYFRDFVSIKDNFADHAAADTELKLRLMEEEISRLFEKTEQLKSGIKRWEDLLKKQKKQITFIKEKNIRRKKIEEQDE